MDYQGVNLSDFPQTNGRQVLQRVENNYTLRYFTENEIQTITNGYKNILGKGSFGVVYKGMLEDGSSVAVKRYMCGTQKEEFANEVIVHSQINHKNVVRLLGCCTEENALMIVMEFISNGNLDNILHGNSAKGRVPFPLVKRIEIAIEIAEVLGCMHSMYSPVLHGDIKPANILLDENLTPKISDFGLARLLCANGPQKASIVIGSIGYLDPAYCENGILTPKSDVYSFGVFLLEVITRKKAVDGTITLAQSFNEALSKGKDVQHMFDEEISVTKNKKFLVDIGQLVSKCLWRKDVQPMFDEEISVTKNKKFLGDIGQLVSKCLWRDVKTRPKMVEVATSLRMIREAMQPAHDVLLASYNLRDFFQTNGRQVLQRVDKNYSLRYFTENEIQTITNGYKDILGEGSFGVVYKGEVEDRSLVAVKRYKVGTHKEEFANEVRVHSQINHKNVVRLLGCCTEENALMIVMELISNGNLSSILHGNSANGRVPFTLEKRIEIAIDVAEAIWFMHTMHSPIRHGDIKPDNILLSENLTPKISDFGIARFLCPDGPARFLCANGPQQASTVIGSIGYLDPTYRESGILTPKSDVYSFGVVLLEVITRKKAVDGTIILAQIFNEALAKGEDVQHMFDEEISVTENMKFLGDIGRLAAKCLQRDIKRRPEMVEVATSLRVIRKAMQPAHDVSLAAYQFGDLKIFNETEMKKMTKNYSMTFRKSRHECLYNGVLSLNRPVIVRLIKTSSETDREIFLNSMSILSQKNHKNVANVVGFHLGKSSLECVYESCCDLSKAMFGSVSFSNRNLYDTICSKEKLPLHERLSIAVQCAEGLDHIHLLTAQNPDSCGTGLFGNFRSANIFLDKDFVPKIFNVNLSTFLGLSVAQKNTVLPIHDNGPEKYYSDPRDVSGQLFDKKSDVYSFGVVLLELIAWKTVRYMHDGRVHVLPRDFLDSYTRDCNAIEFFGKICDEHEGFFVHEAIAIAIDCLQLDIQMRPDMDYVLSCLRIIAIRSKLAAGSNNKPSQRMDPAPFNNTDTLHPTLIPTISMEILNEVTNNFSNDVLIGQGPYAECFMGVLKDGQNFAVKKLSTSEEIQVEVPTILRMCYHDNVVQLLGFFLEGDTRILAYEYAPRAPCKKGIKEAQPGPPLSWLQRVKIAVSAAKGLEFLHEKVDPPIIHSNIKSSNILLFENDVAKIGDIGVLIHQTPKRSGDLVESVWGPCYRSDWESQVPDCGAQAPEYAMTGECSKKSDVYRFGIVLLELLIGRKAIDHARPRGQSIVTWATPMFSENEVKQFIDPRLGVAYPLKAVGKMAAVAELCVQYDPEFRPGMNTVVKDLSALLDCK